MSPLLVLTIVGGIASDLPSDSTVWLDLDARPRGEWQALVTAEQARDLANNLGGDAEIVASEPWDGSRFGDGNCGCVESAAPGILDISGVCGAHVTLPTGWVAA